MARHFTVTLTSGTNSGPYTIYHTSSTSGNEAVLYGTTNQATGLTLSQVQSGVLITVPDNATKVIFFNQNANVETDCPTNFVEYPLTPNATPNPTPNPTAEPTPPPTYGATPEPTPTPSSTPAKTPGPTAEPTPPPTYGPTPEPTPTPSSTAREIVEVFTCRTVIFDTEAQDFPGFGNLKLRIQRKLPGDPPSGSWFTPSNTGLIEEGSETQRYQTFNYCSSIPDGQISVNGGDPRVPEEFEGITWGQPSDEICDSDSDCGGGPSELPTPTPSSTRGDTNGSPANAQIRLCNSETTYYVDINSWCNGSNLAFRMTSSQVGDIVQFRIGGTCGDSATYCGEVLSIGAVATATAVISLDENMNGCNDLRCQE